MARSTYFKTEVIALGAAPLAGYDGRQTLSTQESTGTSGEPPRNHPPLTVTGG